MSEQEEDWLVVLRFENAEQMREALRRLSDIPESMEVLGDGRGEEE